MKSHPQVTVDRRDLLTELQHVARISTMRAKVPILAHVRLSLRDGALDLAATNLDVVTTSWVAGASRGKFVVSVLARRLLGIVKSCGKGDVILRVVQSDGPPSLEITNGAARWRLSAHDGEQFPKLPKATEAAALEIDSGLLRRMLGGILFALSKEDSRFQLQGAFLRCKDSGATLVSTDGHRLAVVEASKSEELEATTTIDGLLVHRDALHELVKLTVGAPPTEFRAGEEHLSFTCGRRVLTARRMKGTFPDYEKVIPAARQGRATLSRQALADAVARVQQMAGKRAPGVLFRFADDAVQLYGWDPDGGESTETVPCELTKAAEGVSIGFNPAYVQQALAAIESDAVSIGLKDGESPATFRPAESSDLRYLCLVMPMHIDGEVEKQRTKWAA